MGSGCSSRKVYNLIMQDQHAPEPLEFDLIDETIGDMTENSIERRNPFDKYIAVSLLGQGAFGKVYKCEYADKLHPSKKIHCVIKIINMDEYKNDITLIINERNTLLLCKHPFIIKLKRSISYHNFFGIVFSYSESITMKQICGKLDHEYNIIYAYEIIVALTYLHSKNIIHRDIKPLNILIINTGHIKLIDFDSAMKYTSIKKDIPFSLNDVYGTINYMAPEIFDYNWDSYTFAVDWWSFGVTLYYLITGNHPYIALCDRYGDVIITERNGRIKEETRMTSELLRAVIQHVNYDDIHIEFKKQIRGLLKSDIDKRYNKHIKNEPMYEKFTEAHINTCFCEQYEIIKDLAIDNIYHTEYFDNCLLLDRYLLDTGHILDIRN